MRCVRRRTPRRVGRRDAAPINEEIIDRMLDVLVAYASRMGGTKEIAEVIGARLATGGLRVVV